MDKTKNLEKFIKKVPWSFYFPIDTINPVYASYFLLNAALE